MQGVGQANAGGRHSTPVAFTRLTPQDFPSPSGRGRATGDVRSNRSTLFIRATVIQTCD
jgi:hypothetical protein